MTVKRIDLIAYDRILWLGFFSLLSGLISLGFFISRDRIKSTTDLRIVGGQIKYCSIILHDKKSSSYSFFIHLIGYENQFKIVEGFVDYFNKTDFDKNVKEGDLIEIYISINDYKNIGERDIVEIYGLVVNNDSYLDSNKCVLHHNSDLPLFVGIISTLLGLTILFFKRNIFVKKE